jgi:hypothetical protein
MKDDFEGTISAMSGKGLERSRGGLMMCTELL